MKKINTPIILIILVIFLFGIHFIINYSFEYIISYGLIDNTIVYISAYDEKNRNLNSELFEEIDKAINKNNIASQLRLDSTSTSVIMYQKNLGFEYFVNWCIYISNQALTNMKNKETISGCVSSNIYVYKCSTLAF